MEKIMSQLSLYIYVIWEGKKEIKFRGSFG